MMTTNNHHQRRVLDRKYLRLQNNDETYVMATLPVANEDDARLISRSLASNTHLVALRLLWISRRAEQEGAREIVKGMAGSKISRLVIDLFIWGGDDTVIDTILLGLPQVKTLRHLEVQWDRDVHRRWDLILAPLSTLQSLTVSKSSLQTILCLSRGLALTTSPLQVLRLSSAFQSLSNGPNTEALCKGLFHNNESIAKLQLDCCGLTHASVATFCQHWPLDSNIHTLEMNSNNLNFPAVQVLMDSIVCNHSRHLRSVNLSHNVCIGYDGLQLIGNTLPQLHFLEDLRVQDCVHQVNQGRYSHFKDHGDRVGMNIERAQQRNEQKARVAAGRSLVQGIQSNTKLRLLDTRLNGLGIAVEHEIARHTLLNKFHFRCDVDFVSAPALWCHVLANCLASSKPSFLAHELVYFFLREHPCLIQQGQQTY